MYKSLEGDCPNKSTKKNFFTKYYVPLRPVPHLEYPIKRVTITFQYFCTTPILPKSLYHSISHIMCIVLLTEGSLIPTHSQYRAQIFPLTHTHKKQWNHFLWIMWRCGLRNSGNFGTVHGIIILILVDGRDTTI